jgi:hypothetical protein
MTGPETFRMTEDSSSVILEGSFSVILNEVKDLREAMDLLAA